ncbi:sugar transferase [Segatella copri]|uniref:Sugar transferase n=1 Tax=Segatella copri TaxID=165179 RepID=A0AA92U3G9_9BACT|nr:sugar transferase [Segatella copri]MCP9545058.1 sugar transferase [Segatella copri]MCP9547914.1 sugar transferase [Segatella copri]MCP9554424.1 sugar transferase [Segatella copri]MCP9569127.1 sugar transferase [Segatella copri]RGW64683.1 sugar transferase [Segatella copri]
MIRFFDLIFSIMGLVILSPLFIVLYLLIRIESKGGGFYSQERIGKNGKPFKLYKFRSMRIGSDKKGLITIGEKDNRITKTGFILRKYKLDELPQLWNVFIGDMSLVGPRPEVKKYTDLYTEEQKQVLHVRPGITDWASIKYVDENKILGESKTPDEAYVNLIMPNKIKLNMVYIQNQTLGEYFKIIFTTFKEIVR